MDATLWKTLKDKLSGLLDLPADARAAALALEENSEVRWELERLLAAHGNLDGFIDRPILVERGLANETTGDFFDGKEIDDYVIIERIGSGGMGSVYLAERINSDFTHKVALKIVKRGMDSEEILRRFAAERRILSRLNHPNIAQLFDGGISREGLPYFVMEFVDGKPLKEFFVENDTSLKERLGIFRQICSAVDYAHKNLIVHRDLKPSNILITKDGVPKLLDFGIAKVLSDEDVAATSTQIKIFTPEYASPEQITGGVVTTASDVYSLGVILYELLTRQRPFDTSGKSYDEIVKSVCETEPRRPSDRLSAAHSGTSGSENIGDGTAGTDRKESQSTLYETIQHDAKILRGDLDNIVLKALRKDPSERYGSVLQLSTDIERYLLELPVLARPQTLSYRFGKYIKRHKAGVAAAAMVIVSLVGGISVATWQAVVARRERARADQRFQDVRQLANNILFDHYDRIKTLPGATEAREKLVSDALAYLDKLAAESADNPDLQRELVEAYKRMADIQGSVSDGGHLGEESKSRDNYLKALAIQEKLNSAGNPTIEDRRKLGNLYLNINSLYDRENERELQAGFVEKGLNIFSELERDNPDVVQRDADLARALWFHANSVRLKNDNEGAIEVYKRAAEKYETLASGSVTPQKFKRSAALTYRNIGGIYELLRNHQKAFEFYQKAFIYDQESAELMPNNVESLMDLSFTKRSLGKTLFRLGDEEKAFEMFSGAIALQERVTRLDPKNYFAEKSLFTNYSGLGDIYAEKSDFEMAGVYYEKSQAILSRFKERNESLTTAIANHLRSYGNFFVRRAGTKKTRSDKLSDLKSGQKHLRDAFEIYQTLEQSKRLDPAYLPNLPDVRESLARADREIAAITNR